MRHLAIAASLSLLAGAAPAQDAVPLYDNLGTLTHRISSRVPNVQQYFDQGLRLTYGFNHAEAIRAFREGARLDPSCAMCWWGVAFAFGPNINLPMDSASGVEAWEAMQQALAMKPHATPAEQAWIDALAARYGADPLRDRAQRDSAFAHAMDAVARRYPADPDAQTVAADAAMNLRPWNYWAPDGSAYPGVEAFVARLVSTVRRFPAHPGACHFLIHAVESSPRPGRALACARRLENAMPGAGHLVHMPGHLYLRLGLYDDARRVNIHAAHADEQFIRDRGPGSFYTMAYYPHNLHFLWTAAAFEGRSAAADSAMQRLRAASPVELTRDVPPLEFLELAWFYHLVWFGRWQQILAEPAPPEWLLASGGMWHYARGRAHLGLGHVREAEVELDSLNAAAARVSRDVPPTITLGFAPPAVLLGIAGHVLAGEIASAAGRHDEAISQLTQAVSGEDALTYNEPADWYYPTRLSLGSAQLAAGRPADAEATYREELRRRPNNGWTLKGLQNALAAQGRNTEAAQVEARFRRAWARADISITSSRM